MKQWGMENPTYPNKDQNQNQNQEKKLSTSHHVIQFMSIHLITSSFVEDNMSSEAAADGVGVHEWVRETREPNHL